MHTSVDLNMASGVLGPHRGLRADELCLAWEPPQSDGDLPLRASDRQRFAEIHQRFGVL